MGARDTGLVVALFTVASVAYLGDLQSFDFNLENVTANGKSIASRYDTARPVKRRFTFSGKIMRSITGARKTNLDFTVFTIGGTDFIGDLKNFSLSVTTAVKDGSGVADEFEYPNATGTGYEISAKMLIASGATTTLMKVLDGTVSSLDVTLAASVGGEVLNLPMTLTMGKHSGDIEGLQEIDVTLKANGTPTTATGSTLLASILAGTAAVAFSTDTGAQKYSGNAIITSARFEVSDSAIVSESYDFACQGAPTVADEP